MKKLFTLIMGLLGFVSANAQCTHTLNLTDTWGDGWNGGSVDVVVDGNTVIAGATVAAADSSYTFEAGHLSTITLENWSADTYPGEYGFEILNGYDAGVIGSGGYQDAGPYTGICEFDCPAPTLAYLAPGIDTVGIRFTAEDVTNSYVIEIGATGFAPGSGTEYTTIDTSYSITGLNEGTAYDFYISSICSGDEGVAAGPYTFKTYCNTIATGWSEDWGEEDAVNLSGCNWSVFNINGGNNWFITTEGNYYISNYNLRVI